MHNNLTRTRPLALVSAFLVLAACIAPVAAPATTDSVAPTAALEATDAAVTVDVIEVPGSEAGEPGEVDGRPVRVLFLGDSYFPIGYGANFRAIALAASTPISVETDSISDWGMTLARHWEEGIAAEAIEQGQWDYVVLEESLGPGYDVAAFQEAARSFNELIDASGSKAVLFLPWPYGEPEEAGYQTQEEMVAAVAEAAAQGSMLVAPVGLAFERAAKELGELEFTREDGSHPSAVGDFLTFLVLFATLFDRDPAEVAYTSRNPAYGLTSEDVAALQRIAKDTVAEWAARTSQ